MRFLLVSLCLVLYVATVYAEVWSMGGYIRLFGIKTLHYRHKVRVVLVSGGMYESECGEAEALSTGYFSILCGAPMHLSNTKHLYMYHRLFDGEECHETKFEDIELSENEEWILSPYDDGAVSDGNCPKGYYDD